MNEPLTDLYLRDCRERLDAACVDPIEWAERAPSLVAEIDRLLATVERLTQERDEARENVATLNLANMRMHEERAALRAALEIVDPPESPIITEVSAPTRCDCCHRTIEPGERVAVFDGEERAIMHAGACPEGDLWGVEFQQAWPPRWWFGTFEPDGGSRFRAPYEEARRAALDLIADPDVARVRLVRLVRLVRVKEPRRG